VRLTFSALTLMLHDVRSLLVCCESFGNLELLLVLPHGGVQW
jgi:hypothetical protein